MEGPEEDPNQSSPLVAGTSNGTTTEPSSMESDDKKDNKPLSEFEDSPDVIILDSDDDDTYTNPEPSKELLDHELINADTIGDTVYSKHWLFTTLMNLIKAVDAEEHAKQEPETSDMGLDLEESLQDELCKLWDMSMNPAVVNLLMNFKAIELLTGVIAKSKAPRAIEICVGILGNMACTEVACKAISVNDKLRTLMLVLLDSPDAPTLVEMTRLLYTCMSCAAVYDLWMTSVRDTPSVYGSLLFILRSSTNNYLLSHTADLIDKIMDTEDDLLIQWSTADMVQAILEAVKQCLSKKDALDTYLHILQLISTCDPGIEALGTHSKSVCDLTLQYMIHLCSEDILILDGQENTIGCVLCVLTTAFQALEDKAKLIVQDFQLMRCLLKVLSVVYPMVRHITPEIRKQTSRSDSTEGQKSRTEPISEMKETLSASETNRSQSPSKETDNTKTESDQKEGDARTEEKCSKAEKGKQDGGQGARGEQQDKDDGSKKQVVDDGALEMLYEVLQNLLVDVVLLVSEENEMSSMTEVDAQKHDEDHSEPETSTASQSETPTKSHVHIPQTLIYLNDLCDRQRLRMLVYTMEEVLQDTEMDCCGRLRQAAQNHKFSRLDKIVEEYSVE